MRAAFLAISVSAVIGWPAVADELRIASWNIANLAQGPGVELRGYVRDDQDYAGLKANIETLKPDVIALQELGSLPAAQAVLGDEYIVQFETRCVLNPKRCQEDNNDIYTAIAYRLDLPGVLETFQIDELAIPHQSECADQGPRNVRGGVGVKIRWNHTNYWIPSLHLKASCKRNQNASNPDQADDCRTLARQFEILFDWLKSVPAGDAVILAGDFNRELYRKSDKMRRDVLFAVGQDFSFEPAIRNIRHCWQQQLPYDKTALEEEASLLFGFDAQILEPKSSAYIDYFVGYNLPTSVSRNSEQVTLADLPAPRRFSDPSGHLEKCDGSPLAFENGRTLTFARALPSDHCPIVMILRAD